MMRAYRNEKALVVAILSASFATNKSVNSILPQNNRKEERLQRLMAYSFDVCLAFGDVFLSDDRKACALLLFPEKKRPSITTIWWDLKLVLQCIGLKNVLKAMRRETEIKARQPREPFYYLWYIGVDPAWQSKGTGNQLLNEVIAEGERLERTICLETSSTELVPWYQSKGFHVYSQLNSGFTLFFLKRD
jgi:ribosomal protein S18 acetylase RimI-like enzyme